MTQLDLLQLSADKVKSLLNKKNITIDIEDDDTYADFISGIILEDYSISELQILLTYNSLLQTDAFSPYPVKFIYQIEN